MKAYKTVLYQAPALIISLLTALSMLSVGCTSYSLSAPLHGAGNETTLPFYIGKWKVANLDNSHCNVSGLERQRKLCLDAMKDLANTTYVFEPTRMTMLVNGEVRETSAMTVTQLSPHLFRVKAHKAKSTFELKKQGVQLCLADIIEADKLSRSYIAAIRKEDRCLDRVK